MSMELWKSVLAVVCITIIVFGGYQFASQRIKFKKFSVYMGIATAIYITCILAYKAMV